MGTGVKNLRSTEHCIGPKAGYETSSTAVCFPSTSVEVRSDDTFRVGYLNLNGA